MPQELTIENGYFPFKFSASFHKKPQNCFTVQGAKTSPKTIKLKESSELPDNAKEFGIEIDENKNLFINIAHLIYLQKTGKLEQFYDYLGIKLHPGSLYKLFKHNIFFTHNAIDIENYHDKANIILLADEIENRKNPKRKASNTEEEAGFATDDDSEKEEDEYLTLEQLQERKKVKKTKSQRDKEFPFSGSIVSCFAIDDQTLGIFSDLDLNNTELDEENIKTIFNRFFNSELHSSNYSPADFGQLAKAINKSNKFDFSLLSPLSIKIRNELNTLEIDTIDSHKITHKNDKNQIVAIEKISDEGVKFEFTDNAINGTFIITIPHINNKNGQHTKNYDMLVIKNGKVTSLFMPQAQQEEISQLDSSWIKKINSEKRPNLITHETDLSQFLKSPAKLSSAQPTSWLEKELAKRESKTKDHLQSGYVTV